MNPQSFDQSNGLLFLSSNISLSHHGRNRWYFALFITYENLLSKFFSTDIVVVANELMSIETRLLGRIYNSTNFVLLLVQITVFHPAWVNLFSSSNIDIHVIVVEHLARFPTLKGILAAISIDNVSELTRVSPNGPSHSIRVGVPRWDWYHQDVVVESYGPTLRVVVSLLVTVRVTTSLIVGGRRRKERGR